MPEQFLFDFELDRGRGFQIWQDERRKTVKKIGQAKNLPIYERVKVNLRDRRAVEGMLFLHSEPYQVKGSEPVPLRVGSTDFRADQIVSVDRLER